MACWEGLECTVFALSHQKFLENNLETFRAILSVEDDAVEDKFCVNPFSAINRKQIWKLVIQWSDFVGHFHTDFGTSLGCLSFI